MITKMQLYEELLENSKVKLDSFLEKYPKHETQLEFNEINKKCLEKIYDELRLEEKILPRTELTEQIDNLKPTCSSCMKHYFSPRNRSAKILDIKLGKKFEEVFVDFLNFKGIKSKQFEKGTPLPYPDIEILNEKDEIVARCEIKYMSAPFLLIYKKYPGKECYESSNTLDVGDKIKRQRKFVEEEIDVPVFYVYWLDYPCIKGVFYMDSENVYKYIDSVGGEEFERKEREGDFVKDKDGGKKKLAQTKKIYLPLYSMKNFNQLFDELKELIGN